MTISDQTNILYFTSEDGFITPLMQELDGALGILKDFKFASKTLGTPIRSERRGFVLYACIVRKTNKDPFSFEHYEECLLKIRKEKNNYDYVAFESQDDEMFTNKLVNLTRSVLHSYEIHVCLPTKASR